MAPPQKADGTMKGTERELLSLRGIGLLPPVAMRRGLVGTIVAGAKVGPPSKENSHRSKDVITMTYVE